MQCDSPLVRPLTNRRAALHACYNSQTVGKRVTIRERERERLVRNNDSQPKRVHRSIKRIACASFPPISILFPYKQGDMRERQTDAYPSFNRVKVEEEKKIKHFVRVNNSAPKTCVTRVRKDRTSGNVTKTTLLEREGTTTG